MTNVRPGISRDYFQAARNAVSQIFHYPERADVCSKKNVEARSRFLNLFSFQVCRVVEHDDDDDENKRGRIPMECRPSFRPTANGFSL